MVYKVLYFCFIAVFLQAIPQLLGAPPIIIKLTYELPLYFFILFLLKKGNKLIALKEFVLFSIVFIISALLDKKFSFGDFTYYRPFLNSFIILNIAAYARISDMAIQRLFNLLNVLVLIQIIASFIKLFLVGPYEEYVGTFGISAGNLNTIFPLYIISFLIISIFRKRKTVKSLILILLLISMGWIGAKRGIYFYFLVMMLILYLINDHYTIRKVKLKTIFIGIVISVILIPIVVYFAARISPTLNPDNMVGGKFDYVYLKSKIIKYNIGDASNEEYTGRWGGNIIIWKAFIEEESTGYLEAVNSLNFKLFGYGPDIGHNNPYFEGNEIVNIKEAYVIPTGFVESMISTGILGTLFMLIYYFRIFKLTKDQIKKYFKSFNTAWQIYSLGIFGNFILILILDYFTYTNTITYSTIYYLHFFLVGILLRKNITEISTRTTLI